MIETSEAANGSAVDNIDQLKGRVPKSLLDSKEAWREIALETRASYLVTVFWVSTEDTRGAEQALEDCLDYVALYRMSIGMLVIGGSGAGKTWLVERLQRKFSDTESEDRTLRAFVLMKIPSRCNESNLVTALLEALHDPEPTLGGTKKRFDRAIKLFQDCAVRILAVDNFHDIPEKRDKHGVRVVGNWFRELLDERLTVAFLALGTEDAQQVRHSNNQVRRRIPTVKHLAYFTLTTTEGQRAWVKLLFEIDLALPLADWSDLAKAPTRVLLFIACNGVFDYLMKLLRQAVPIVVRAKRERIESSDLKAAYRILHGDVDDASNPFSANFDQRELIEFGDPFFEFDYGSSPGARRGATSA